MTEVLRIVSGSANPGLAGAVANHLGDESDGCDIARYPDGELRPTIENVCGADVYIVLGGLRLPVRLTLSLRTKSVVFACATPSARDGPGVGAYLIRYGGCTSPGRSRARWTGMCKLNSP